MTLTNTKWILRNQFIVSSAFSLEFGLILYSIEANSNSHRVNELTGLATGLSNFCN